MLCSFPRRRGFTLIELLVVIAIIAILASILFPVFAKARESARQTACRNNIKQICTALQMYQSDYDEVLVPSSYSGAGIVFPNGQTGGANDLYCWFHILNSYIKNTGVFNCPSIFFPTGGYSGQPTSANPPPNPSYGMNVAIWNVNSGAAISDAQVGRSSDLVLLSDNYYYRMEPDANPLPPVNGAAIDDSSACNAYPMAAPHNQFGNVGYYDGHVKSINPGSIYGGGFSPCGGNYNGVDRSWDPAAQ